MYKPALFPLLCATTALASSALANEAPSRFTEALTSGKPILDARYRYEFVDQDGLPNNAHAHTLRTRLGYETGDFQHFKALVEFENITGLGPERYNDTVGGRTAYPVVADPEDTNLNRLQLTYTGLPETSATLGRQLVNLDNQRFVGSVGWRQNDQTLDAISVKNQSIGDTTLFYAYANQVNRVFGTDSPVGIWNETNIHLVNIAYSGLPWGRLTGYAYLLDIPDALVLSTATYGARFEGKHAVGDGVNALLNLEYARQNDHAGNPSNIGFNYYSIEPAIAFGQWILKAQYESIEGDGINAMQFPLGTNHAFGGWVDKFLMTPSGGLVDASIGVVYTVQSENAYLNDARLALFYHDFSAERGGADYGTEWDALAEKTFKQHYTAGIKLGIYEADNLFTDTVKIMPYIQIKF